MDINSRKFTSHTSNGIIESLLGQMASLIGGVEDLVVEDGEVQRETETDGVGGCELGLGDVGGSLSARVSGQSRSGEPLHHTLYASCAAVAATLRFSPEANSAR